MRIVRQQVSGNPFGAGVTGFADAPNTAAMALAAAADAADQARAIAARQAAAAEQAAFAATLRPAAPAPAAAAPTAPAPARKAVPAPKRTASQPRKAAPPKAAPRPIRSVVTTVYEPRADPVALRSASGAVTVTSDDVRRARRVLLALDEVGRGLERF